MSESFSFDPSPSAMPSGEAPPPQRPFFPPPVMPHEPQRRGRGCGFWAGWLLALVFLVASGVLLLALMGLSVGTVVEEDPYKTMIEKTISGKGDKKILLLPIEGIINDSPREQGAFRTLPGLVTSVHKQLQQAQRDSSIKAVVVRIDSPGGGITASDMIHDELKRYKLKTKNKVVVCMDDVAASGGYYVAAASDKIIAHPTTITGSIGVIMFHANIEVLLEKIGVATSPIKSGPMKDIGSWTRPIAPEEELVLQDIIDEMYERFIQIVSEGRAAAGVKMTPDAVRAVADGRIYTAVQAKDLDLVDQIGYLDDAIEAAKQLAKLKEAKVVQYFYPAFTIFDLLSGKAGRAPAISLNLESLTTPRPPQIMYLWTGGMMPSK